MHVRAARLPGSPLSVRLGDSFEGARLNSFGRVVPVNSFGCVGRGRARANEPVSKNAKLCPEVGFVHVRAARLPGSPLSLRFGESLEGARLNSFGRVIRVNSFRRVGRGRTRANEPVSKNAKL